MILRARSIRRIRHLLIPAITRSGVLLRKVNYLLDVGQAENLYERTANHDRKDC